MTAALLSAAHHAADHGAEAATLAAHESTRPAFAALLTAAHHTADHGANCRTDAALLAARHSGSGWDFAAALTVGSVDAFVLCLGFVGGDEQKCRQTDHAQLHKGSTHDMTPSETNTQVGGTRRSRS
ncbi:MAG: hypothetical protein EXS16_03270 [Gemmataceae bacterium]|nr:hypothetical protein [Gemmataceae bacterium]